MPEQKFRPASGVLASGSTWFPKEPFPSWKGGGGGSHSTERKRQERKTEHDLLVGLAHLLKQFDSAPILSILIRAKELGLPVLAGFRCWTFERSL